MTNEYVLATNDNGDLAVRTVNATESSAVTDTTNVITRTDDGKLAIRVVGAGGGDQHNLGYYATQAALEEAYPTATAGDWAIVGATDTVWIWDTDTSAWVDSDQKGQVTSVNNQTGAVTIGANDILPSQTGYSGRVLGTDGFVAGWVEPEIVQRSTIPQASADELGNIYQFVGTTDANYTNGYFYKCVSDGQEPATYSWSQVSVQPAPDPLPSQTGNSGKFLTTDGTDASWGNALVNAASSGNGLWIKAEGTTNTIGYATSINTDYSANTNKSHIAISGSFYSGATPGEYSITIKGRATGSEAIALGGLASGTRSIAIGFGVNNSRATADRAIAIGNADVDAQGAIQIGVSNSRETNSDANTFKVANANGNFEIMSADGTVPHARLTNAVVSNSVAIAVADWNGGTTCTKTVSGLTATSTVWVAPDNASQSDYLTAGVYASAQTTDTITFTCTTTPTSSLTVNVIYC